MTNSPKLITAAPVAYQYDYSKSTWANDAARFAAQATADRAARAAQHNLAEGRMTTVEDQDALNMAHVRARYGQQG